MNTKIFFLRRKKKPNNHTGSNTALIVINIVKILLGHSKKWQIPKSCILVLDFSLYNLRDHSAINPIQSNLEKCEMYNLNSHFWATSANDK